MFQVEEYDPGDIGNIRFYNSSCLLVQKQFARGILSKLSKLLQMHCTFISSPYLI